MWAESYDQWHSCQYNWQDETIYGEKCLKLWEKAIHNCKFERFFFVALFLKLLDARSMNSESDRLLMEIQTKQKMMRKLAAEIAQLEQEKAKIDEKSAQCVGKAKECENAFRMQLFGWVVANVNCRWQIKRETGSFASWNIKQNLKNS